MREKEENDAKERNLSQIMDVIQMAQRVGEKVNMIEQSLRIERSQVLNYENYRN